MHPSTLPKAVLERMTARRGRPYAFNAIDPTRTALVVIDMQNAFMAPGAAAEVPAARGIVPNINRLADGVRQAGGTVAWVYMELDSSLPGAGWPVFFGEIFSPDLAGLYIASLTKGSEGQKLWPELDTRDSDLFITKTRFSGFLHGASDAAERLNALGIDTLIITGTLTNVCCESSARDAMMRGFRVIMVGDGNATRNDDEHMSTLVSFHQTFGDVRSTDETLALLKA